MTTILCIALHLYHGPVDENTRVTVLAETCTVTHEKAGNAAIAACAAIGDATKCEALAYTVPSTRTYYVTIEHKRSTIGADRHDPGY